ncbi:hypothetical protein LDO26_05860 [Luteimonas sp. BDR2-5]|uniref:hypothetical protein n=1 Tax=Proluteimonas luteida TaxID=2878685 RepID=UPI001E2A4F2D|nr:hypothetical protein [Luteimonas sp. BDR2-5]MCD9027730.1 hypothetical protein [Luteimonas sp. BDR2-5]
MTAATPTAAMLQSAIDCGCTAEQFVGLSALFNTLSLLVPTAAMPPDTEWALAELATDGASWRVVHRAAHPFAIVREPIIVERSPWIVAVDLRVFDESNSEPEMQRFPLHVLQRLWALASEYRLRHAVAGGNG